MPLTGAFSVLVDPHDLTVAHIQLEVAADAAVGTGGHHLLYLIGSSQAQTHLVLQSADRAISHTSAATLTTGVQQQLVSSGYQFGLEPAVGETPDVPVLDIVASADAASANDALVAVDEDEGIRIGVDLVFVSPTAIWLRPLDAIIVDQVL